MHRAIASLGRRRTRQGDGGSKRGGGGAGVFLEGKTLTGGGFEEVRAVVGRTTDALERISRPRFVRRTGSGGTGSH